MLGSAYARTVFWRGKLYFYACAISKHIDFVTQGTEIDLRRQIYPKGLDRDGEEKGGS